jgi:signal transduction histidine kinase
VTLTLAAVDDTATILVANQTGHHSEEDLVRILDRLGQGVVQLPKTTTCNGLGLSIARWMLEKQGGSISLAQEGPDLVRATIRLPLAVAVSSVVAGLHQVEKVTEVA